MQLTAGAWAPTFQPQSIDARDDATRRCALRGDFSDEIFARALP
jgi:hypothetical protein